MKHQAFQEFVEKISKLDPFLDSNQFEKLTNKYFREFQVSLGTNGELTLAHLFSAHLNTSSTPNTLIANDPSLPSGFNLTSLKRNPNLGSSKGFINDIFSITDKIVDPKTGELILMPLLMHNFSKPFNISSQMLELADGLRCSDDSKPKIDSESLTKISSKLIEYLKHFEAPYQSAEAQQMSLMQMYGILQTVEGFQKFGIAVKKPIARGACAEIDFAEYPDQAPRFNLNPALDVTINGKKTLGSWNRGKIDLSNSGIRKPYVINHEFFHTFLRMYNKDVVLAHIDDLKILNPLLDQGNLVAMSILGAMYPSYIPTNFTKTEGIGALDHLLLAAARNGGSPQNLPNNCNGNFITLNTFFPKSCPDGNAPRLFMETPYSEEIQSMSNNQNIRDKGLKLLLNTVQIECLTAISTGLFQLIATSLKLNEEAQKPILSTIETASRIGFVALYEDINSAMNLAIISGSVTSLKMLDFASQTMGFGSPKKFAQELVGKIGEATIGEEMTKKISDKISDTPRELKKFASRVPFVFALHAIDNLIKDSENKDDKAQIPKIEDSIIFSLAASLCSALICGIIDIGVRKLLQRQPQENLAGTGENLPPAITAEFVLNQSLEAPQIAPPNADRLEAGLGDSSNAPQPTAPNSNPSRDRALPLVFMSKASLGLN